MNLETKAKVERRLIAILVEEPSLSLNDIFSVIDSMRSSAATKEEPVAAAPSKTVAPKATQTPKKSATSLPKKVAAPVLPDLRKAEGRQAYDAMIMSALVNLGGANISAREIGAQVPGSDEHRRNSLHQLMKQGSVTTTGQKAATKYSVVAQAAAAEK